MALEVRDGTEKLEMFVGWVGLGLCGSLPIKCYHLHDKASSEDYVRFL